jgi:N-terminal domain of anti-restriction factor ArdC/IrrE N-terminal-like domain
MKTKRPHHRSEVPTKRQALSWADLLVSAVREPGRILAAYRAFHEYSLGNQLAAYEQCLIRGIAPAPLGTYRQWQERGRQVRQGEKALWLCVPRTVKASAPPRDSDPAKAQEERAVERSVTMFSWQPRWFVLSQTEGEDVPLPTVPAWDRDQALGALGVTVNPFAMLDGNTQGYARGRGIAINPLATLPMKTLFHELGHVLLHEDDQASEDGPVLPRSLREVEAEAVALLCCETLDLPGAEFARGYIQHWLGGGQEIPERSAQRILGAADKIIRAGTGPAPQRSDPTPA